jgi:hypothetical protein
VALCYLESIADPQLVAAAMRRISIIDTDGITVLLMPDISSSLSKISPFPPSRRWEGIYSGIQVEFKLHLHQRRVGLKDR